VLLVVPAIDVMQGRVVRLKRGNPEYATAYGTDPVAVAAQFAEQGALRLHVVDLDGAFGRPGLHPDTVRRMAALGVAVEVAGGVRTLDMARRWLDCGASDVVVGSVLADPPALEAMVAGVGPARLIAALDVAGGALRVDGWRQVSGLRPEEAGRRLHDLGLTRVIVTGVDRDGMGLGPDLEETRRWAEQGFRAWAAGGIRGPDDLRDLEAVGAEGAVVGRALYEGWMRLDALGGGRGRAEA
jgi:phosphoribosylformimino-5-aminoimidazole carboxamide ribotide isomerase